MVRLGLPMVIVVYDDEAYGAEVHHFGPSGHPMDTVTFPPADLARIARGYGCAAVTVTQRADLGRGGLVAGGAEGQAAAGARQGGRRARLLVAGGGLQGSLTWREPPTPLR
ncbi:thiamine pyrophosphate-dependent enzyme [Nonomuraea dietziae]|uniref:thiamine pyrophosphate-dependent enzyme n=1 Tax=Nonomuraea dietziae TaxID=65515 RepID=UPI0031E4580F